jgi:hypothetical protein
VTFRLLMGAATTARSGAPDSTWQSLQWHTITRAGSINAVNDTAPQWQAPSMCMGRSLYELNLRNMLPVFGVPCKPCCTTTSPVNVQRMA